MKRKSWILGIVTSGIGVLLVRVGPGHINTPTLQLAAYLVGVGLALTGLIIIAFGISKRIERGSDSDQGG